jgi:amino acid efflux transporter
VAVSGLAMIALYGLGLASPAALVMLPTTLFLMVYLGCMIAAVRVLRGPARLAAAPAAAIVALMLGYCGWALLAPALVAVVVLAWPTRSRRLTTAQPVSAACSLTTAQPVSSGRAA